MPFLEQTTNVYASIHGSGSRDSIVPNSCRRRTITYDASVSANCSITGMLAKMSNIREEEIREAESKWKGEKEGMLTTQTNSRSAIERKKLPCRHDLIPTLWAEFLGIFAIEIFTTVHGEDTVQDLGAGFDEEG